MLKALNKRNLGIATLSLWLITATPGVVLAEEGELSLSAGAAMTRWADTEAETSTVDGGLALGATWWLTDFWSAAIRLRGGLTATGDDAPAPVAAVSLEARYVLDALTWVPWACAGAGGSWGDHQGAGGATVALVHGGVGIDYRPSRSWSVGLAGRYHLAVTDLDRIAGPMELSLVFRLYPGDP